MKVPLETFAGTLPSEVRAFLERVRALPDVARVAVMPDVHLAGEACVGMVVATRATLRPFLLGSDLGCGVAAMHLGDARRLDGAEERVLRGLVARIPLLAHPGAELPELGALSMPELRRAAARDGAREHGTIGRGSPDDPRHERLDTAGGAVLASAVYTGLIAVGTLAWLVLFERRF